MVIIIFSIMSAQAAEAFGYANFQFISCLDTRNETKKVKATLNIIASFYIT